MALELLMSSSGSRLRDRRHAPRAVGPSTRRHCRGMEGNGNGSGSGTGPRWFLVIKPEQADLIQVLQDHLQGSGVEVVVERRTRERRRGSLGPAMDRRMTERRRQRPIALMTVANAPEKATMSAAARPTDP